MGTVGLRHGEASGSDTRGKLSSTRAGLIKRHTDIWIPCSDSLLLKKFNLTFTLQSGTAPCFFRIKQPTHRSEWCLICTQTHTVRHNITLLQDSDFIYHWVCKDYNLTCHVWMLMKRLTWSLKTELLAVDQTEKRKCEVPETTIMWEAKWGFHDREGSEPQVTEGSL